MRGSVRVLLASPLLLALLAAASRGEPGSRSLSADEWYDRAVEATLTGDVEARQAALDAAIEADPDHAPSRGERGEIEAEGRWVSARYAQYLAVDDPERREYQQRLEGMDDTPSAHTRMAKWCDRAGLTAEARPHWLAVLKADPDNAAALEGLGMTWRDGQLWDAEQAAKADDRAEELAKQAREWENRFRRFESKPYMDEDELARVREDLNAGAIDPIEARIARLSQPIDPKTAERLELLVEAFLERAVAMPDTEVTASLSRIAIYGGDSHRPSAIEALKDRPETDVMPMLLSHLIAPIDSEHQVTRDREGNVVYQHRLKRENAEHDQVHERTRTATVAVTTTSAAPRGFRSITTSDSIYLAFVRARFEGLRKAIDFESEAAETDAWVDAYNDSASELNDRVRTALREVSNRSLGEDPREWWDYWRRYSGYDIYARPVERTYDVTSSRQMVTADPTYLRLPPRRRCECFVAGTPVWTRDGRQAIETLKPGDLVMSRDPHRGGLVYRVVTDTTVREPSPMVEVVAGDETIRATVGHPFWVVGQGWRMAQQLAEGDVLSTLRGYVTVTAVNEYENAQAYNLVVEGAANYYVGEQGVLVHDNTPRVPAVGLVARR